MGCGAKFCDSEECGDYIYEETPMYRPSKTGKTLSLRLYLMKLRWRRMIAALRGRP